MQFDTRTRKILEEIEERTLASYATRSADAAHTRLSPEESHPYRTAFQRDRDRIVHSRAFRRLKHKRQVFLTNEGDHYRTRLTHTLEVSQLSRTIAKTLGLSEELVEAISLGHDLGHTPFGHIGEYVLHKILKGDDDLEGTIRRADYGGFKHNYQSLRIVDRIEKKYEEYGLNLTLPVREGIVKHTKLNRAVIHYPELNDANLNLGQSMAMTLEGQVVAMCDEIAQHTHDLEDGVRAHFVEIDEIRKLTIVKKIEAELHLGAVFSKDQYLYRNLLIRGLINLLVTDVIENSIAQLRGYYQEKGYFTPFDRLIVNFSPELEPLHAELDEFIDREIIYHASIDRADDVATNRIRALFKFYYLYPSHLPDYATHKLKGDGGQLANTEFIRTICDYIAGMTDNFAESEFNRIEAITRSMEDGV